MPNEYREHCTSCDYNPANGYSPERVTRSCTPLSIEKNSERVLLIFQAPGVEEWLIGKPISGNNPNSAAARIRNALNRLSLNRTDFSITNAVQCLPGKAASGRDKRPSSTAQRCCSKWLRIDIESADYSKVVVFGDMAKKSVADLGFLNDRRFLFLRHPSGGLSNDCLDRAFELQK
jgi:uracil-DNA glycosylase family 4